MADVYTHGHHESVLASHRWRTVANSAAFLLPYVSSKSLILDVGCGPGNISAELSRIASEGHVVAIDLVPEIIHEAQRVFPHETYTNLDFEVGDAYELKYQDETFDIVYAHQLLQHMTKPVEALREFHRVLKPNGLVAIRDADYSSFIWNPDDPLLDEWLEIYQQVARANLAFPDGGALLPTWVKESGFVDIQFTQSSWIFTTEAERKWWGGTWAERVIKSDFAKQAIKYGYATDSKLQKISEAFLNWSETENASFTVPHGEVIARKP